MSPEVFNELRNQFKNVAVIASWIDKKKGNPYRLKIYLLNLSLFIEEFSINKFHRCCDYEGPTVVIIKILNSEEIIGGYNNPLGWRSDHEYQASDSIIFSLFSLTDGVTPILSRVSSKNEAIVCCGNKGPCFGLQDLWIQGYGIGKSIQKSYEKKIINKKIFDIKEYEVFKLSTRDSHPLVIKYLILL